MTGPSNEVSEVERLRGEVGELTDRLRKYEESTTADEVATLTAELRKHEARSVADEALADLTSRLKILAIPLTVAVALGVSTYVAKTVEELVDLRVDLALSGADSAISRVETQSVLAEAHISATTKATKKAVEAVDAGRARVAELEELVEVQKISALDASRQAGEAYRQVALVEKQVERMVKAIRPALGTEAATFEAAYAKGEQKREEQFSALGKTLVSIVYHPSKRDRALEMQRTLAAAGYSTEVAASDLTEMNWTQARSDENHVQVVGVKGENLAPAVAQAVGEPNGVRVGKVLPGTVQVWLY